MATATVDFSAIDDTQPADTGTEPIEQPGGIEPGSEPGSGTEQPSDGRRGPQNVRGAIKAASEALPEQAATIKSLGDAYFRAEAYSKTFPTVQEAQTAKQLIEGVGGLDGITQIQHRQQQYDAQDEGLRSGNPEVLATAFKDFPDGMVALAGPYLEQLERINPDAAANTIAPYAIGMLNSSGMGNHLAQMAAETDPAKLKQMAQQADQWMKEQSQNVKQMKQAAQQNPLEGKLKEQQTQLQQQQEQFFSKQVDTEVNSRSAGDLTKVVDQYAKTHGLNEVQKAQFATSLTQKVVNDMLADDTFKKQDGIRKSSKDVEKVASYRASEFTRRLNDTAFSHWNDTKDLYGKTTPAQKGNGEVKPGGPKTAPGGGPLMVSRTMDVSDLDMSKDPNQYLYIANKGYRKGDGAFVTWK